MRGETPKARVFGPRSLRCVGAQRLATTAVRGAQSAIRNPQSDRNPQSAIRNPSSIRARRYECNLRCGSGFL